MNDKVKKMSFFKAVRKTRKNGFFFFQLIVCYTKVVHLHGFFLFHKMQSSVDIFIFQMVFLLTLLTTMKETKIKLGICFPTYNISSSVNNEVCSLHQWKFQSKNFHLYQINFLYGNKLLRYISNIKKNRSILISNAGI